MTMTPEDFERGLDLHGLSLEKWPHDLRDSAQHAVDTARGAEILARAKRLQHLLDQATQVRALSGPQLGRLLGGLEQRRARSRDPLLFLSNRRSLAAAMGLALVIFTVGAWTGTVVAYPTEQVDLAALDLEAAGLVEP